MATFQEIQTRVNRRVIDLPTAVQLEVPILVNEAIKRLAGAHNFKVMEVEAPYTTTLATRTLGAVPSDFKEHRGNPYELLDDGSTRPVYQAPDIANINRYYTALDEGPPNFILDPEPDSEGARSYQIWPLPDGNSDYDDGEYRIRVPYWRYPAILSASGDTNWFTVNAEEYIVFQATSEAFAIDWDEERSVFWATKAASELRTVIKRDKFFRLGDLDVLVPHKGAKRPHLEH